MHRLFAQVLESPTPRSPKLLGIVSVFANAMTCFHVDASVPRQSGTLYITFALYSGCQVRESTLHATQLVSAWSLSRKSNAVRVMLHAHRILIPQWDPLVFHHVCLPGVFHHMLVCIHSVLCSWWSYFIWVSWGSEPNAGVIHSWVSVLCRGSAVSRCQSSTSIGVRSSERMPSMFQLSVVALSICNALSVIIKSLGSYPFDRSRPQPALYTLIHFHSSQFPNVGLLVIICIFQVTLNGTHWPVLRIQLVSRYRNVSCLIILTKCRYDTGGWSSCILYSDHRFSFSAL